MYPPPILLIVTVGNEFRGDDGAAVALYRRLRGNAFPDVLNGGMAPENIIGDITARNPGIVLIIDTMDFGGTPGDIRFAEYGDLDSVTISTHGSLTLFMQCLTILCGAELRVLGIQPGAMGMGEGLSPAVEKTVGRLAEALAGMPPYTGLDDIGRLICEHFTLAG